ncbi:3-dehydroquinate synthase [Clostridium sp. LBM24168]
MKEIQVNSQNNDYKICIDRNIDGFYNLIEKYSGRKIFLITDDIVYKLHKNVIQDFKKKLNCRAFHFQHGEENKSIHTVSSIYDFLLKNEANRGSILIGIGGGLVGDIAGFTASTYMRGIKFINIPTTMLSQIDSCIGGKVGYNFGGVKNLVGNFFNPELVYVCPYFLNTLDGVQFRDGLGELVKYGIIDSEEFFNYIDVNSDNILNRDKNVLLYIIERCLTIKKDVVAKDFRDTGLRNILNFGHTIGHAVEISSDFRISHGEAVALGILTALKLSEYKFNISPDIYISTLTLIKKLGLPTTYKIKDYTSFLYAIRHDKKNNDSIRFVLVEGIGKYRIKVEVEEGEINRALRESIDN